MDGDPYLSVFRVLDDLRGADTVPPGASGTIHAAIDRLRADRAPPSHLGMAETLSTTLLRWHWATLRKDAPRDCFAGTVERIRAEWLDLPLPQAARVG